MRDFIGLETKGAVPEVLAFSQVSHLLDRADRVSYCLEVCVCGYQLLLTQFYHHFGLVVEDFYFFCG
jgi:hypothetical protein